MRVLWKYLLREEESLIKEPYLRVFTHTQSLILMKRPRDIQYGLTEGVPNMVKSDRGLHKLLRSTVRVMKLLCHGLGPYKTLESARVRIFTGVHTDT